MEREEPISAIVDAGFDRDTVTRVERLINTAEYKRRQAAPGVKVTLKNFGRDRRYPITNRFRDSGTPMPAPDVSLIAGKPTKVGSIRLLKALTRLTAPARKSDQRCARCVLPDRSGPMILRLGRSRRCGSNCRCALIRSNRLALDARLRKLFSVLLGDDDVTGCDRIIRTDRFQSLCPAFTRPATTAFRTHRFAVLESGRQFGIRPTIQRDRLRHFLARIVIGIQRHFGGRTHALTGHLHLHGTDPAKLNTKSENRNRRMCERRRCGKSRPSDRVALMRRCHRRCRQTSDPKILLAGRQEPQRDIADRIHCRPARSVFLCVEQHVRRYHR